MNKLALIPLLVCSFAFGQAQYDPSADLRQTFCSDQGDYTKVSINHTQALRSIVEGLQADENCAAIASSTNALISNLTSLQSLKTDNTALGEAEISLDLYEQEFASYQANFVSNYIAQNSTTVGSVVTSPADSAIQTALDTFIISDATAISYSSRIADLNVDKIDLQLSYGFSKFDKTVDDKKNRLIAIQNNLSSVLGQLSASSHCTNNNTLLKTNGLSLVAGLASTFMNDIAGTAVSLAAGLVTSVSDLVRTIKTNTKLNKLKNVDFMDSIKCSYFGMAKTYCSARNANRLVQNVAYLKSGSKDSDKVCKECSNLLLGLKLKNKKMRVLNQWITSLFAASAPVNLNAASPKEEAEDLRGSFAKLKIALSAIFSDARTDLSFATTDQQKENILASLFNDIYVRILLNNGGISEGSTALPYANSFSADKTCGPYVYLYSNGSSRTIKRNPNLACLADVQANYGGEREFSVIELESIMNKLNLEAQEFVANEIAKSSKVNDQEVLKEFDDLSYGTTPRKVIYELMQYNKDLLKYLEGYSGEKKNLIALIDRMNLTYITALEKESQTECTPPNIPTGTNNEDQNESESSSEIPFLKIDKDCTPDKLAEEKVSHLSFVFVPRREELYIQDAFNSILKTHVDIAVERGDITSKELITLLSDETNNQVDVLSRYALTRSAVADDTETAMSKTKKNIEVFSSMFEKELYRIIKRLKSKSSNEDTQTLGRLCIASLVSDSNSRTFRKIKSLCRGTYIRSLFPRELKNLRYNDSFGKSYEDKICTMFEHNQRIQFLEDRI